MRHLASGRDVTVITAVPNPGPQAPSDERIAYLISRYPLLSHTFIEGEIRALEALGRRIDRFSVRPCPTDHLLSDTMIEEAAATTVVLDKVRRTFPPAHVAALRRAPGGWFRGLGRAVHSGDRTARARLWQVFYFAEAVTLLGHLRTRGIRHVHVHFPNVSADVARLVVHLGRSQDGPGAGWRWSMTIHGPTEFESVDKIDLAAKVRDADGIMAISDFARSQLMRLTDPEHWPKMRVVRMAVDERRFSPPADRRHRQPGTRFRVLSVGRLVPEKGSPVLLEALAELVRRGVDVEAAVIGIGPLRPVLERRIHELGLSGRIRIVGAVGQDAIVAHYHWADTLCLPSFQEGLPVVLMEALATELPVVATRIAAVEELVRDGGSGHVVPPGRSDRLAEALADLASDPNRRALWGAQGRGDVLERFTAATTAPAMNRALAAVRPR